MPKINLGKKDYEAVFGAEIKASIIRERLQCDHVAKRMGIVGKTLTKRFKQPSSMPLGELKVLIKLTGIEPDEILQYLYEKKP